MVPAMGAVGMMFMWGRRYGPPCTTITTGMSLHDKKERRENGLPKLRPPPGESAPR